MAKPKRPAPVRVGDHRELTIEALVGGGEAIARLDGFPVFVPYAVPGDRLKARVISVKPGYARALIEQVLEGSPKRIQPRCPVFTWCGGCQWQGLDIADQLDWKTRLVGEALQRLGGLDPLGVLKDTMPSPSPWHYRNKVHWALGKDKNGWQVGLYEPRTHQIVDARTCAIQGEANNHVLTVMRQVLNEFDFPLYDAGPGAAGEGSRRGSSSDHGWMRSVFAKIGHGTQDLMVGIVTATRDFPRRDDFIARVRELAPEVTTIVQNIHPDTGNKLLGDETLTLFGPGVIREKLGPIELEISGRAFFQVNAAATELLYGEVARAAHLDTAPRIIDAYCGAGAISLFLAAQGASSVIGLEVVAPAVRDAEANARRNGLEGKSRFVTGPVEKTLPMVLAEGQRVDVLVLDPPRKGCEPEVLEAIAASGIQRVIYVSCNPATLARDLAKLTPAYRVLSVQPVDMFPQTAHVECVAVCERVG